MQNFVKVLHIGRVLQLYSGRYWWPMILTASEGAGLWWPTTGPNGNYCAENSYSHRHAQIMLLSTYLQLAFVRKDTVGYCDLI